MNMIALSLGVGGFFFVLIVVIQYFRTIPRFEVSRNIGGLAVRLIAGILLCTTSIYLAITGDNNAGPLVYVPAVLGSAFGAFNLWLLTQRKTPIGDLKVSVGDALLPFTAVTSTGLPFESSELIGRRTLLKFYRGGWCPFCSAELVAFNEMSDELGEYGVSVVAISKDTPDEAALHKERDQINFPLLSDSDLSVIRQYGVEHHKAIGQKANPKRSFGGIPLGPASFNFSSMAIPTTLLIDESGVVQWIDQSDDYRVRSSMDRVLSAVKETFIS